MEKLRSRETRGSAYIYNTLCSISHSLSQQAFIELLLLSGDELDYNDIEMNRIKYALTKSLGSPWRKDCQAAASTALQRTSIYPPGIRTLCQDPHPAPSPAQHPHQLCQPQIIRMLSLPPHPFTLKHHLRPQARPWRQRQKKEKKNDSSLTSRDSTMVKGREGCQQPDAWVTR